MYSKQNSLLSLNAKQAGVFLFLGGLFFIQAVNKFTDKPFNISNNLNAVFVLIC